MALPTGRNTTYAAGVQVKAADLNDVQDCLIGGKCGEVRLELGAGMGVSAYWTLTSCLPPTGADFWLAPATSDVAVSFTLPLRVGDRIRAVYAYVQDTTGGNKVTLRVGKQTMTSDACAEVGTADQSAGDASKQTLAVGSLTETITAGVAYVATIETDSATTTTDKVWGVAVVYDHP